MIPRFALLTVGLLLSAASAQAIRPLDRIQNQHDLDQTVSALDAALFDAYNKCDLAKFASFIDDQFTGSASDSGAVPAGLYDLDVICLNAVNDCLLDTVTWSATY